MADAELIHAVEAAINQMQDSRVDAQSTLSAFTDHDIRTTWQLLALSDSDWQTVAPGLSIGMRAAIKALAARPMTQRQPAVTKENADPITEQQVEHAFWDDAKKFFGSTEVWVSVDTPWLQRLACSGQDPRSLRSAVCAWMEGYSITWLLFFATVTPRFSPSCGRSATLIPATAIEQRTALWKLRAPRRDMATLAQSLC